MEKELRDRLVEALAEVPQWMKEDYEDDHDVDVNLEVTVLLPEGCFEVLWDNRRFHIVVQELDADGNEVTEP